MIINQKQKFLKDTKSNIILINNALADELPENAIEKLVYKFSDNGLNKTEIYELLYKYYITNKDSNNYKMIEEKHGDHPIELTMDRLWGYCSIHQRLLPNESIKKQEL